MIGDTIIIIPKGFVGGYELPLLVLSISISLILTGPGKISIEWDVLNREIFPKGKQKGFRGNFNLEISAKDSEKCLKVQHLYLN